MSHPALFGKVFVVAAVLAVVGAGCTRPTWKDTTSKTSSTEQKQGGVGTTASATAGVTLKESAVKNGAYMIDTEKSVLRWHGRYLKGLEHYGTVKLSSGSVNVKDKQITGGTFTFDLTTIEDDTNNERLEKHLRSDDFFAIAKYPTATLSLTRVSDTADGNYGVTGKLTIKGIPQDISFPAAITVQNGKLVGTAEFSLDRTLWDIQFRSGKFFPDLGDKMISDEMDFKVELVTR